MSTMTIILIAGGGLILLLVVIGLVVTTQQEKRFVSTRLDRFAQESLAAEAAAERAPQLSEWLGLQITRFAWGQGLSRSLARADIKLRVGEFLIIVVLITVGVAFGAWFFGGRSILSAIIGAVIGLIAPNFYIRRQQGRRLIRFDEQLGDMLNLVVNGLRAGYSTMQALEAVSRELPPPISDEFRRVVQEMQLGISTETALDNLWRRVPSKDLDLVITAMNVQREVGGNLAEILDTISHTIRERVRIKGEIRVLVSQVMISGRFLAVMPVLLSLALYFLNRPYMMNFFEPATRWLGIPMLIIGAIMIAIGYYAMTKLADIEV